MNFQDYQSQIRTLIPLRNDPDFNDLLNKILFGESNSEKFLIKMELNRLCQPCVRIIDLRDRSNEKNEQYNYGNLSHYLTPTALKAFKNAVELYGSYTVGAYEYVMDQLQKQKQQQEAIKTNVKDNNAKAVNSSEVIDLNSYATRSAPRMFFVSPIDIFTVDGREFEASTVNISINGLKVKLTQQIRVSTDETISILFNEFINEYPDTECIQNKINYRVLKQQLENNSYYLYLSLQDNNQALISFIQTFIRNNQYKYKMDVHYYFQKAKENALKHCTLMAMNCLPIYLDVNSENPLLFMLRNGKNASIINDWVYNDCNQLSFLFSELRLVKLLEFAKNKTNTTLYTFTYHNNGTDYLLSATEEELTQENFKQLFIEYGNQLDSWRTYHLTLQPYTYVANIKHQLTDVQPKSFSEITHVATLTPISANEPLLLTEQNVEQNINDLNKFVHRDKSERFYPVYDLFPDELRKEERYEYKSAIRLVEDDYSYTGSLIDFSYSGLKIKLDKVTSIAKRSVIKIDFVALQKLSKNFPLTGVDYRVVATSKGNIYHLQVASKESFLNIRKFFMLLVEKNPQHFEKVPLRANKQPALPRLHEVAEPALNKGQFYVSSVKSGRPKISYSAIAPNAVSLLKLFKGTSNKEHNYSALSNNQLLERILYKPLRSAVNEPIDLQLTIYVKKVKVGEKGISYNSYLDSDFASKESKMQFIDEQREKNQLQVLHYRLTTIKKPDLAVIKSEIKIISRYAMHFTKRLEEELTNIGAMIEVIDRTEHILPSNDNG